MVRRVLIDARADRTQEAVAMDIGISQQFLSKLELGILRPSSIVLARLSRYYSRTPEELFPDIFLPTDTPKQRITKPGKA